MDAYRAWQKLMPKTKHYRSEPILTRDLAGNLLRRTIPEHFDGDCCTRSHFFTGGGEKNKPVPDVEVCPRERAWRTYVILRDGTH